LGAPQALARAGFERIGRVEGSNEEPGGVEEQ
jgi:hypothetical protein